jgi:predicted AAA+ superfamily ATPase
MIIIHAVNASAYRPRALEAPLEEALRTHPVVVLSGGRQTGKTTLARHLPSAGARTFLTLDDLEILELARKRPQELLARGDRLTIDEVQRVPELLLAIKQDVDRRRRRGRFLLTGSANLLLMRNVSESLAGRAVYMLLSPFTQGEKQGTGAVPPWTRLLESRGAADAMKRLEGLDAPQANWRREILTGGMPRAFLARSSRERTLWFEGFVRTYLERDLREVSQIPSLPDFRRLMTLATLRLGQLLNQTELGRDAGLSQPTTHRYLNLLETTFQIHRLPAYAANPSKRLIKAPKLYWSDAGLASYLAGVKQANDLGSSRLLGPLLENLVLGGLLAWRESTHPSPAIYYWRTAAGAEIDFVIELGSRLLPIEVKSAKRVHMRELGHLEGFLGDYAEQAPWGLVLCDTDRVQRLGTRLIAAPLAMFI